MNTKKLKLANGLEIPVCGVGTWKIPNDDVVDVVREAIEVGYRLIDTAQGYENEEGVGKGIKASGIHRKEIFVITKINADYKTYERAKKSINESLKALDTDYIDLLLIHSPRPFEEMFNPTGKTYNEENIEVYRAMEEAYKEGKLKAIGISNFQIGDMDNIIENCEIKPMMNQLLVNITHYPKKLIDACQERGIAVGAYSPNATGKLKGELLTEMAEKYNCFLPQLGNRFDIQLGCVVLPKTTHKEYMIQNLDINFDISNEDMETLKNIGQYEGWKGSDSE